MLIKKVTNLIYFDNNATTPLHPKIVKKIKDCFENLYYNPSSIYTPSKYIKSIIEETRENIKTFFNANFDSRVIFTSGGTEANNLIIKGIAYYFGKKYHYITSEIEHPSVLNTFKRLKKEGFDVSFVKVDKNTIIDLEDLKKKLKPNTKFISIMIANNESGAIEPLKNIIEVVKNFKDDIIIHSDFVQGAGKIRIDLKEYDVDSFSISGHKLYALKGVGALWVKNKKIFEKIVPLFDGGHQEYSIRPGTENVIGIYSLNEAIKLLKTELNTRIKYIKELRDYFEKKLIDKLADEVYIVAKDAPRVCNTSYVIFKNVNVLDLLVILDINDIAVSTGSACQAGLPEPSHVLKAAGIEQRYLKNAIRFSFGIFNKKEEIDILMGVLKQSVIKLKEV